MKRVSTKAISLILALVLCAGLVPAIAFASDEDLTESTSDTSLEQQSNLTADATSEEQGTELMLAEESSEGQGEAISGVHTVSFKLNKIDEANLAEFKVLNNELSPGVTNPTKEGMIFSGWYYEDPDDASKELSFSFEETRIVSDLIVYAKFAESGCVVKFVSPDGGAVLQTLVLAKNSMVAPGLAPDVPSDLVLTPGTVFTGAWRINSPNGALFNFNQDLVSADLTLYPELAEGYRVWFVSNAQNVESQIITRGSTIDTSASAMPALSRSGYTARASASAPFQKWYTDVACTQEFDFASSITAETTLYAGWDANTVQYRVSYWLEKPNVLATNEQGAPAQGSSLSAAQMKDINNFEFIYLDPAVKTAPTGSTQTVNEAQVPTAAKTAMKNHLQFEGPSTPYDFAYSETKTIAGDGTTVINVFFTRAIYTISFNPQVPTTSIAGCYAEFTINGETYTTKDYASGRIYSVKLKVGEDMTKIFPYTVSKETGLPTVFGKNSEGVTLYYGLAWCFFRDRGISGDFMRSFYLESVAAGSRGITYNMRTHADYWHVSNVDQYQLQIMVEALDQEAAQALFTSNEDDSCPVKQYGSKYYLVDDELSSIFYLASNDAVRGGVRSGLQSIGTNLVNDGSHWSMIWRNNRWMLKPNEKPATCGSYRYCFYDRLPETIKFSYGEGGVSGGSYQSTALYGDVLSEPPLPTKPSAIFQGWYEDSDFRVPFVFDENTTMPSRNLLLYAKWMDDPCTVSFYGNTNVNSQTQALKVESLSRGSEIPESLYSSIDLSGSKPTQDATFIEWREKVGGVLVPYDFSRPLSYNLNLYACWTPAYAFCPVVYDANGGSGFVPQDSLVYNVGSLAAVKEGAPTRANYAFIGWKIDGDSRLYNYGTSFPVSMSPTVLKAQWVATSEALTVRFFQNATASDTTQRSWTTASGATISYPFAYDLGFTRDGYVFAGWSTQRYALAADSAYAPGLQGGKIYSNLDLYAVWIADASQYSVTHLVLEEGNLSVLPNWPQTYSAQVGESVSASVLSNSELSAQNLRHIRTSVGEDPFTSSSSSLATSASIEVGSLANNTYANTIAFYYEREAQAKEETPPLAAGSLAPITPPSNAAPGTPTMGLFGQDVPLLGNTGDVWSWFNLLCTILAVLFVLATALRLVLIRRKDDESKDDADNKKKNRLAWLEERERNKEDDEHVSYKARLPFFVASIIGAIALIIFFVITQDIMLPIAIFDLWSFAFGIILVATVGLALLAVAKVKDEEEVAEDKEPVQGASGV